MSAISAQELAAFERARCSRDARFDGLFFIAVKTTKIYCRPLCPAPPARAHNVCYYRTASEAQSAGYRPCLRCRPELAPDDSRLRLQEELADQAWLAIQEGALDTRSPAEFAAEIGLSERQLRRVFLARWRSTPAQVAATRRVLIAKQLLTETDLPVTEIAFAAGFRSVRGFNAAIRDSLKVNPRDLRKQREQAPIGTAIGLRLSYRPPYDWPHLTNFLKARALPEIEAVDNGVYRRVWRHEGVFVTLEVSQDPKRDALNLVIRDAPARLVPGIVRRVRRAFDLDADPAAIAETLAADGRLRASLKRHPGLRLPVGLDAFETGVRAILGQQISVAATRTLLGRLLVGEGAARALPEPTILRLQPANSFGIPIKRAQAVLAFADAIARGDLSLSPLQALPRFIAQAVALPGIGPWTANYMAMRALGAPDAFVVDDLIIKRQLGIDKSAELIARSEAWRPWRAYAVLHLWNSAYETA